MPTGYYRPGFVQMALVSVITHILFGYEPKLLPMIYKSESHMHTLEENITAILFPSLPSKQSSTTQNLLSNAPEMFTDAIQQYVIPTIMLARR